MTPSLRTTLLRSAAFLAVAGALSLHARPALACGDEPYTGEICYFALDFCPTGYLAANGAVLPISNNQALYSLYYTTYGGDGKTTFGLPDLRGRAPVGIGQGLGLTNVTLGLYRGSQTMPLTVNNLPQHTHTVQVAGQVAATSSMNVNAGPTPSSAGTLSTVSHNYLANVAGGSLKGVYTQSPPVTGTTGVMPVNTVVDMSTAKMALGITGGQPAGDLNPGLGLTVCIGASGSIYPPRP